MKNAVFILTIGTLLTVLIVGCSSNEKKTEGKIEYHISFPEFKAEEHIFLALLLPKKQVFSFKGNHFHSAVKKAMVEINIISNTADEYFYTDLMFNERMYFEGTISQDDLDDFKIEFTDKKDTIAGFNVKQALAKSNEKGVIELWYTEEIAIKNPNWHTPYFEVPGVLLEFTVIENGVTMHFRATKFSEETIDEAIFIPSKKGKQIDFHTFQNQLTELFENFLNS
jgi:GLPGLI family protein